MSSRVVVVHAGEQPPRSWTASLFLAGPTPRSADVASWRPEAMTFVARAWRGAGTLVVFLPEPRDGERWPGYEHQRTWELYWGDRADAVLFWIPRAPRMPALTTNDEFGRWKGTGRVVLGTPPDAESVRYQRNYATDNHIPVADSLEATIGLALTRIGDGAERADGHRHVPLLLWRTLSFQSWLKGQEAAGNELRSGRVEWTFRIGENREIVFLWAFHAQVYVRDEDRIKANEVVVSRPDITSVLAYRRAADLLDTEIVLVREFRTPSAAGTVLELPGGSSWTDAPPQAVALTELYEETGLKIDPERVHAHHSRQLAATFSAHRQHLFSVELTADEIGFVRANAGPYGEEGSSERTYPRVERLGDLIADGRADWTTLGAITEVLVVR
jgi:8-oxo-dGTP pyrophosphatase MutT (NUDIX family)